MHARACVCESVPVCASVCALCVCVCVCAHKHVEGMCVLETDRNPE